MYIRIFIKRLVGSRVHWVTPITASILDVDNCACALSIQHSSPGQVSGICKLVVMSPEPLRLVFMVHRGWIPMLLVTCFPGYDLAKMSQ